MPLPQGMTLQRGFGDHTVWVVGPGGRYALKNPAEAAKLVGQGWVNEIQDVLPGSFEGVPEFGSMDQALRATPAPGATPLGGKTPMYGGQPLQAGSAPGVGGTDFGSAYNRANQYNNQLYGNILQGYQNVLRDQQQAQQGVREGYGQLQQQVMGQLSGVEDAQRQAIADQYQQGYGQLQQQMAGRGLGNTTIGANLQRGLMADRSRADTALTGEMGRLRAGVTSDLGQAGLGYGGQALRDNAALSGQQFDWMAGTKMDTPDPLGYAGLSLQRQKLDADYMGGSTGRKEADGSFTITTVPGVRFSF